VTAIAQWRLCVCTLSFSRHYVSPLSATTIFVHQEYDEQIQECCLIRATSDGTYCSLLDLNIGDPFMRLEAQLAWSAANSNLLDRHHFLLFKPNLRLLLSTDHSLFQL
jgi:hypothetical protein